MKDLLSQFADFAASKDANEDYDYVDPFGCAFCQFLKDQGYAKHSRVVPGHWGDGKNSDDAYQHELDDRIDAAVLEQPWTWRALATRLAAVRRAG